MIACTWAVVTMAGLRTASRGLTGTWVRARRFRQSSTGTVTSPPASSVAMSVHQGGRSVRQWCSSRCDRSTWVVVAVWHRHWPSGQRIALPCRPATPTRAPARSSAFRRSTVTGHFNTPSVHRCVEHQVFQPRGRVPKVGTWNDFWGTGARFNDHKYQQLDSLEILLFSGTEMLRCSVSSLYSHTHTDLSRCRGKNHSKRARI